MYFLFSLALRNLSRNVRRTVITSVAVVFGVALMILGWGLVEGLDENYLRASRTTFTGDVVARPDGYPDDGLSWPLDESVAPPPDLATVLAGRGVATARTLFQGRLVKGPDASRVLVVAYDDATETAVFDRKAWALDGRWPESGEAALVAGTNFADLMGLHTGDEVVIEARTPEGAINALSYTVSGIVRTDNGQVDNFGVWMPMSTAQNLVQLGDRRTHLCVRLDHERDAPAVAAALSGGGWAARPLREEIADLLALNVVRARALSILVFIVMAIAATGIANTVIMATFERIREIGTLLSLGMRKVDVRAMFLFEGAAMGLVAGTLGAALGSAAVYYWQVHGIELPSGAIKASGSMAVSAFIYTRFTWWASLASLGTGVLIAVGAAIYPAYIAANLNPADAVRAD